MLSSDPQPPKGTHRKHPKTVAEMKEELAAAVHEYQDLAARILGFGLIHHGT
ncbi:hypothetical protein ART_0128 [Arthrobacter sp. PAMC 25486]|nr:hypothetical protein ART_0128 [Arthrobacter sp. PAMC 25486]